MKVCFIVEASAVFSQLLLPRLQGIPAAGGLRPLPALHPLECSTVLAWCKSGYVRGAKGDQGFVRLAQCTSASSGVQPSSVLDPIELPSDLKLLNLRLPKPR